MIDPLSRNVFLRRKIPIIGSALEGLERNRLEAEELSLNHTHKKIWLVSDIDRNSDPFRLNKNVTTVPLSLKGNLEIIERPTIIGFHGTMSYQPNKESAEYLLHEIGRELGCNVKKFHIHLIGRNIGSDLIKSASRSPICTKICFSPNSISQALSNVDIYVAPIFSGSGMQNKILEAIQLGIPVITTEQAAAPFNLRHNVDLLIARNATEFSDAILNLSKRLDLRSRLIESSRLRIGCLTDAAISEAMVSNFE
jgi:hypothetical protein